MKLTQTAGAIDLADPYHDVSLPVGELGEPVPVGLCHGCRTHAINRKVN